MSINVRKRTSRHVRPAKIQINLRIRAVWSESSLGAFWTAKDKKSENSSFTERFCMGSNVGKRTFRHVRPAKTRISLRMRGLIRVFVVHGKILCILSIQNAHDEDSDQTVRTLTMIHFFVGRICPLLRLLTLLRFLTLWLILDWLYFTTDILARHPAGI